jgi:hypothetical protein
VNAFHARRVDPDLAVRTRLRQIRHPTGIELEAQVLRLLAAPVGLERIGAEHGPDQIAESRAGCGPGRPTHRVECTQNRLAQDLALGLAGIGLAGLADVLQKLLEHLITRYRRPGGGTGLPALSGGRLLLAAFLDARGSKRASKYSTSRRAISGQAASVCSM